MNKVITTVPKKTMDALVRWSWPGNIRELENFIERSVILTLGPVLAAPIGELEAESTVAEMTLGRIEREHILRILEETKGKLGGPNGAAGRLGLHRTTLQSKLRKLGIDLQKYRAG